jgi:hypothetical protein
VTIAVLPTGTAIGELGRVPRLSPGLMSPGLGRVLSIQTYLDIGQGNRVFTSLYEERLPFVVVLDGRVPPEIWRRVRERAEDAPANLVPGLLGSSLAGAGGDGAGRPAARAVPGIGAAALMAADERGRVRSATRLGCGRTACQAGLTVRLTRLQGLSRLVRGLRRDDLLIAIERPPAFDRHQLAVAMAGRGFDGNLTSDSTRQRGLVLSTDLAPTVLERLGVPIPSQMSGRGIRAEGDPDWPALLSLEHRLSQIGLRRGPVVGVGVLAWIVLALVSSLAFGERAARLALPALAISCALMPAVLLLTAALEPTRTVERLIAGLGAPALAAVLLILLSRYAALAAACGITVLAYTADLVAGSPLTSVSLLGPNPGLGVRFYGIGNELEATLAALTLIGVGSALTAWMPITTGDERRRAAIVLAAITTAAAVVFSAGRLGADVGAAIVLAAGAAVAAGVLMRIGRRRTLIWLVAAPAAGLTGLVGLDLVLGGDAHLTRSVLDAGGLDDLGNVVERRLRLSARSFVRPANSTFLLPAGILIGAAIASRQRLEGWFAGRPAAWAAFLGTAAATLVGTLANDSGALILIIGTGFLTLFAAFAWAAGTTVTQARVGGS